VEPFDAVVFAGGGCRCAWQGGFWETAAPALGLRPRLVGAVSAGAMMAAMAVAGDGARCLAEFTARVARNPRNLYPRNLLRRRPVFPHAAMYRDTILASLAADAVARLQAGPDVRVLLARLPPWLGARSGVLVGFLAYHADLLGGAYVHGRVGRRVGFRAEVVSMRACRTVEEVADLVLHSSATPPFTPVYRRDGRPVLDGGLIDSVPVEAVEPEARRTLVLLTQPHPAAALPRVAGRVYVAPSEPVPVHKWDYTSAGRVRATYDLGRRDGERFVRQWGGGAVRLKVATRRRPAAADL
jgi:predicted patatin/cPLA2 family phospholipase